MDRVEEIWYSNSSNQLPIILMFVRCFWHVANIAHVSCFSQWRRAGIVPERRSKSPIQVCSGFGDRCHMAGDCQHGPVEANEVLENGRQPVTGHGGWTQFNVADVSL
jgi:hypothetical protein